MTLCFQSQNISPAERFSQTGRVNTTTFLEKQFDTIPVHRRRSRLFVCLLVKIQHPQAPWVGQQARVRGSTARSALIADVRTKGRSQKPLAASIGPDGPDLVSSPGGEGVLLGGTGRAVYDGFGHTSDQHETLGKYFPNM